MGCTESAVGGDGVRGAHDVRIVFERPTLGWKMADTSPTRPRVHGSGSGRVEGWERGRNNFIETDHPFRGNRERISLAFRAWKRIREDDAERQRRHSHAGAWERGLVGDIGK